MSLDTNTHCDHLNNSHAATCRPMPGWREAMGVEAESLGQGVPRQEPGNEKGTGGASGTRASQRAGKFNEPADEQAFRLRSAGYTYRQIGDEMGVDASMAHRRVKRHALRQKMYRDEKLEEAREFEFEKMRLMERALLPEAADGDHASIKLMLRIMELRRKYLKDIPLDCGESIPAIEERAELLADVVDEESQKGGQAEDSDWTEEDDERCWAEATEPAERSARGEGEGGSFAGRHPIEKNFQNSEQLTADDQLVAHTGRASGTHEVGGNSKADSDAKAVELFSRLLTEAVKEVRQPVAEKEVAASEEESTKPSTKKSMERKEEGGRMKDEARAKPVWHGY